MHLSIRDIQSLLAASGRYGGDIDGDAGPRTLAATEYLIAEHTERVPARMSLRRRLVAAAQLVLEAAGYDPGDIDGYDGHVTREAFDAWAYRRLHGNQRPSEHDAAPVRLHESASDWPQRSEVEEFYGPVGENQTRIKLAYPMRLAWNQRQTVTQMTCHQRVAEPMRQIFAETLETYGKEGVVSLRLDQFGGCFNVRRIRGGQRQSLHSWGIAVDLDPINNRLRWGRDRAFLARPEYDNFWSIVEATGAISLGRASNFDWMHFQFARP